MPATDFDGEGAVLQAHGHGTERYAAVVPRSVRHLSRLQREPFADLQRVADQVAHLEAHAVDLVADCRSHGVSWAVIGFALGLTGEGARHRYGASVGLL